MSFFSELSLVDLQRLRKVVHQNIFPKLGYPIEHRTDYEADRIIEAYGEETAQNMIKQAIDAKVIDQ